jgi:diketogulonate reductase-like aldo/keto reductase
VQRTYCERDIDNNDYYARSSISQLLLALDKENFLDENKAPNRIRKSKRNRNKGIIPSLHKVWGMSQRQEQRSLNQRRRRRHIKNNPSISSRVTIKAAAVLISLTIFVPILLFQIFVVDDESSPDIEHFYEVLKQSQKDYSLRRRRQRQEQSETVTMNVTNAVFGANVSPIGVGFGTAGLGGGVHTIHAVTAALEAGFRKIDTAEADYWYDQKAVGQALKDFSLEFQQHQQQCDDDSCPSSSSDASLIDCRQQEWRISTKIPPWELTSVSNIRQQAAKSREELLGFCEPLQYDTQGHFRNPFLVDEDDIDISLTEAASTSTTTAYPMDTYYIHAPACWSGWHPRCDGINPGDTLPLREAWRAMEAVVAIDHSAARIGLSNVHPPQLLDIIRFVQERQRLTREQEPEEQLQYPPPRMPDVLQAYADPLEPAVELRRICEEHGIEFVSYSTLGTQHAMRNAGENPVLGNSAVQQIARSYGDQSSSAEVVLRWALQKGMSVIPRSSKPHHIRQLARLLDSGSSFGHLSQLTNDEVETIDRLSRPS